MPDTLPLTAAARAALVARLTPDIGHRAATTEVARAAAGQPTARVLAAWRELLDAVEPAVAAVGAGWAATATGTEETA